jgi:hypothetical protein
MLVTTGLWVAAVGLVALSLESLGTALVLHRRAVDQVRVGPPEANNPSVTRQIGSPLGA